MVAVLLLRMILDHGTVDACAGGVTLRLSRVLGSPSGPGSRRARLRSRGAHPQVVAVLRDGRRSTRTPTASERVMMLALACCTWAVSGARSRPRACRVSRHATRDDTRRGDEKPVPLHLHAVMCLQKELSCISCTCITH